jgi:hypothetical protein
MDTNKLKAQLAAMQEEINRTAEHYGLGGHLQRMLNGGEIHQLPVMPYGFAEDGSYMTNTKVYSPEELRTMKLNQATSIVDAMKLMGDDSSFANRKRMAEQMGIQNYVGNDAQNQELMQKYYASKRQFSEDQDMMGSPGMGTPGLPSQTPTLSPSGERPAPQLPSYPQNVVQDQGMTGGMYEFDEMPPNAGAMMMGDTSGGTAMPPDTRVRTLADLPPRETMAPVDLSQRLEKTAIAEMPEVRQPMAPAKPNVVTLPQVTVKAPKKGTPAPVVKKPTAPSAAKPNPAKKPVSTPSKPILNTTNFNSLSSFDKTTQNIITEIAARNKGKVFLTDKGTKSTIVGTVKNGKVQLQAFPVLTGEHDKPGMYPNANAYSKLEGSNDKTLRYTPTGAFALDESKNIYGKPGLTLRGTDDAYHVTYPGEYAQRTPKYTDSNINNNNVSWGCINGRCGDIATLTKMFDTGDSSYVIDTRLPYKDNVKIINTNKHKKIKEMGGLNDNEDGKKQLEPFMYKGVDITGQKLNSGFWEKLGSALNPYNWGVDDYSEYKTRDDAFTAARKAGDDEFMYNHKRYNTRKDIDDLLVEGTQEEKDYINKKIKKEYPEFFKLMNRGKNVEKIIYEPGVKRAYYTDGVLHLPPFKEPNKNWDDDPLDNLVAELSHLKDQKLHRNPFYTMSARLDYMRDKPGMRESEEKTGYTYGGEQRYNTPGTVEHNAHMVIEPALRDLAIYNFTPEEVETIQKELGITVDGHFGPETFDALHNKGIEMSKKLIPSSPENYTALDALEALGYVFPTNKFPNINKKINNANIWDLAMGHDHKERMKKAMDEFMIYGKPSKKSIEPKVESWRIEPKFYSGGEIENDPHIMELYGFQNGGEVIQLPVMPYGFAEMGMMTGDDVTGKTGKTNPPTGAPSTPKVLNSQQLAGLTTQFFSRDPSMQTPIPNILGNYQLSNVEKTIMMEAMKQMKAGQGSTGVYPVITPQMIDQIRPRVEQNDYFNERRTQSMGGMNYEDGGQMPMDIAVARFKAAAKDKGLAGGEAMAYVEKMKSKYNYQKGGAVSEKELGNYEVGMYGSGGIMYNGTKFPGYNKPISTAPGDKFKKQMVLQKGGKIKLVKFGHR